MGFESIKRIFGVGFHSPQAQELERIKDELHASLRHLDEVIPEGPDTALRGASENLRRVTGDVLRKYRQMHPAART